MSYEAKRFPLIIWEGTEDYKEHYRTAQARLAKLGRPHQEIKFDEDGPVIWINGSSSARYRWTVESALDESKKRGATGWWTVDEMEQFAQGEGLMVEEAMWDKGFRRHKSNPLAWAIRDKKGGLSPRVRAYNNRIEQSFPQVPEDEIEQLRSQVVLPNEPCLLGRTFYLQVGINGMIFVTLDINPFVSRTEDLHLLVEQEAQRAHICRAQDCFGIRARNINLLGHETTRFGHMIQVEGVVGGQTQALRVWPSRTTVQGLYTLAGDLLDKVGASSQDDSAGR